MQVLRTCSHLLVKDAYKKEYIFHGIYLALLRDDPNTQLNEAINKMKDYNGGTDLSHLCTSVSSVIFFIILKQDLQTLCGFGVVCHGEAAWWLPQELHTTLPQWLQWYWRNNNNDY